MNGGTANVSYADFKYGTYDIYDHTYDNEPLAGGSHLTVTDGTFTNSNTAASLKIDEQANFENTTVSNVSTGLDVGGTAVVTFRGSFSDVSGKAIQSCSWDDNTCVVDAAYIDWGSADGPFASSPSDDQVCGSVTVAPWVHGSSTYNYDSSGNMYQIPNCGGSSGLNTELTTAADNFTSALAAAQLDCNDGLHDACSAASAYEACFEDASI